MFYKVIVMYTDEEKIQLMKDFDTMNEYEEQNFPYDGEFPEKLVKVIHDLDLGKISHDSQEIKNAMMDLEYNLYGQGIFLREETKFFEEGFEIYLNIGINSKQLINLIDWLDQFTFEINPVYEDGFASLNIMFLLKPTYEYDDINSE